MVLLMQSQGRVAAVPQGTGVTCKHCNCAAGWEGRPASLYSPLGAADLGRPAGQRPAGRQGGRADAQSGAFGEGPWDPRGWCPRGPMGPLNLWTLEYLWALRTCWSPQGAHVEPRDPMGHWLILPPRTPRRRRWTSWLLVLCWWDRPLAHCPQMYQHTHVCAQTRLARTPDGSLLRWSCNA